MKVLIVESNPNLAHLWADHMQRSGFDTDICHSQTTASEFLLENEYKVIVLNLTLQGGSALAVADYASYRWPHSQVIFVTGESFFSDGSIFNHSQNVCAFVPKATQPDDLTSMVDYYASRAC